MNTCQVHELRQSGTYNGVPIHGTLIETHISWVILTPQWVFKIKKPISYPFLDFSTLAKRKHYCERELTLNSRLTHIYVDVIPIRKNNGYHLGEGKGEVIDYALRMKRLQGHKKMDEMIRKKRIGSTHIKKLAEKIAHFHQDAEIINTPFDLEETKNMFNDILIIKPWAEKHLDREYVDMIDIAVAKSDAFLENNSDHIQNRILKGFQRDCHGDLHAKNIFLYKDPVVFDCLEFNDRYRQIDVLNDVAFFCMDLESFGLWDYSRLFMDLYLEQFPCVSSLEDKNLFTYFKFYRANVRAKVNALRAMQASGGEREELCGKVREYLELMEGYGSRKLGVGSRKMVLTDDR